MVCAAGTVWSCSGSQDRGWLCTDTLGAGASDSTNIDAGVVPGEVTVTKPGWQGLQPLPVWAASHKTLVWDISKCPVLGLGSKAGRQQHLAAPG